MSEGVATEPVTLSENPALIQSTVESSQAPPRSQSSLDAKICALVDRGEEQAIISLLKTSSLEDINCVSAAAWQRLVPVLIRWSTQAGTERETMCYSIAFHILTQFPDVWAHPALRSHAAQLSHAVAMLNQANIDLAASGGLARDELRILGRFLRQFES